MREEIINAIEEIKPAIQMDGGDIEFVDFKDNVVTVRLMGACVGCPMSQVTLKGGIENFLKEKVSSEITVEAANE